MAQHYSDPSRADDPHALPDVETFYCDGRPACVRVVARAVCDDCGSEVTELADDAIAGESNICIACFQESRTGWYWWTCFPGCMPDSDPFGPFATEAEALADAQEGAA
jgi:hypothetical protein